MKNVISIHSVPRSGSSWLLSIFDSHPETKCVYQPLFSYAFKNALSEDSTQDDFSTFVNNIKDTTDDFCTMKSNYHTNNGQNKPLEFKKDKIQNVVMKHTTHIFLMENIIEWDKNIKVIGLIRDPKNTIASQMKAKHEHLIDWLNGDDKNNGQKENYFGFNKWLEANEYFFKLKKKYSDNVYLVKYENLIKNPLEEINKLFMFCNLELTDETIKFIQISSNTDDTYDYSVFRNNKCLINKKSDLPNEIIDYINNKYT